MINTENKFFKYSIFTFTGRTTCSRFGRWRWALNYWANYKITRYPTVVAVAHVTFVYRRCPLCTVLIVLLSVQTAQVRCVLMVRFVIVHKYIVRIIFACIVRITNCRNVNLIIISPVNMNNATKNKWIIHSLEELTCFHSVFSMDCPSFGSHRSTCTMFVLRRNNSSWLRPIVYPSSEGPSNSSSSLLKTGAPGIESGESSTYSSKRRFFTLEPDRTTCIEYFIFIAMRNSATTCWPLACNGKSLLHTAACSRGLRSSIKDQPSTARRGWIAALRPLCPWRRPQVSTRICFWNQKTRWTCSALRRTTAPGAPGPWWTRFRCSSSGQSTQICRGLTRGIRQKLCRKRRRKLNNYV